MFTYAFVVFFLFVLLIFSLSNTHTQKHAILSFLPASNEGGRQQAHREIVRQTDGRTEACTNETKREGGIEDFLLGGVRGGRGGLLWTKN